MESSFARYPGGEPYRVLEGDEAGQSWGDSSQGFVASSVHGDQSTPQLEVQAQWDRRFQTRQSDTVCNINISSSAPLRVSLTYSGHGERVLNVGHADQNGNSAELEVPLGDVHWNTDDEEHVLSRDATEHVEIVDRLGRPGAVILQHRRNGCVVYDHYLVREGQLVRRRPRLRQL